MTNKAFTLAEVLITLGIIGVVASMTLPSIVSNARNRELESQYKVAYSLLSQAMLQMRADYGQVYKTFFPISAEEDGQIPFVIAFQKYFKHSSLRAPDYSPNNAAISGYRTYDGKQEVPFTFFDDGLIDLSNSMSIYAETWGVSTYLILSIDINGYNKRPNRLGYDVFSFVVSPNDVLLPIGSEIAAQYIGGGMVGSDSDNPEKFCNPNGSSSNLNGIGCAYKAASEKDYFKNLPK